MRITSGTVPLANILSIDLELAGCKRVLDNFYHEWDVTFTEEEVEKMTEYQE